MFAIRKATPLNCLNSSASGVGQPAGGVASHVPGFFKTLCRGLLGPARTGARTDAITHENKTPCAPIENSRTVLGQGRKCSFADPMLHECHAEGDAACRHKPKGVGGRQPKCSPCNHDCNQGRDCPARNDRMPEGWWIIPGSLVGALIWLALFWVVT